VARTEARRPMGQKWSEHAKTTKANPPLTYAEKIGPQCLMLLPSHPAYQLRWSNDDKVW